MFTPFLMFTGWAEEAMNFYTSIFKNSKILRINRFEKREEGIEGSVKHAIFSLNGQNFMCIDSFIEHGFTSTPTLSIFVTCESENEIDELFKVFSAEGQVLISLDQYPFSKKFALINDRFGVSWQFNLP